jgi:hypothetical protein
VASHQPATAAAAQQLCVPLQQLRAFVCGCMAHPGIGELTCAVPLAHLARAMTRFGLVITAPDKSRVIGSRSPERFSVYCYYWVAGALLALKQARGWHFG